MRKFCHYGEEVLVQTITNATAEEELIKNGIKYIELLLLEDRVFKYFDESNQAKYLYAEPVYNDEEYTECLFITGRIPDDMNWKRLSQDIFDQIHGEKPMKIQTKARVLYDEAFHIAAEEKLSESKNFLEYIQTVAVDEDIDAALMCMGFSLEKLKTMDHDDVPELD